MNNMSSFREKSIKFDLGFVSSGGYNVTKLISICKL